MRCCVWSCTMDGQTWTVGVTGATGYAGGEVCRLLAGHPALRLTGVHAAASAARRLGELQPHLLPYADLEVRPSDPAELAGYDVVVLALPHGESAAVAAQLPDDVLVIDCGADHRLADPAAWARWYGGGAAPPRAPRVGRGGPASGRSGGPPAGSPSPAATRPRSPSRWPPRSPRGWWSPTSS